MLFFETHLQILIFLFSVLSGIMLGIGLDRQNHCSMWHFAVDLLVILFTACWLSAAVCLFRADKISGYQFLGCIVGIWVYFNGMGKVKSALGRRRKLKEGIIAADDEV